MGTILEVFIGIVTILFLFYVCLFFFLTVILAPLPGIEPVPPALEGEVLSGPPRSLQDLLCFIAHGTGKQRASLLIKP